MSLVTGLAFVGLTLAAGILLAHRLFRLHGVILVTFGALLGIVLTSWAVCCLALVLAWAGCPGALAPAQIAVGMLLAASLVAWSPRQMGTLRDALQDRPRNWLGALLLILCAAGLMGKTFGYDAAQHEFHLARYVHSDFASHLPLIRSFSLGDNIPPQLPLFAGEPIRYHFLFYLFTGLLERAGLPIDWAVNLPSVVGFAGMVIALGWFVQTLAAPQSSRGVAALTVLLFLTSSSLAAFTQLELPQPSTLTAWLDATLWRTEFLNDGPYGRWDGVITGRFWNLGVFINQRHFAFGIAYGLLFFTLLIRTQHDTGLTERQVLKRSVWLGLLLGLLPLFHGICFLSFMLVSALMVPWWPRKASALAFLVSSAAVALPQWVGLASSGSAHPQWHLCYGLHGTCAWSTFVLFWVGNLGLKFLLIPVAIWQLRGTARQVFLAGLGVFLVPNLVAFGPDIWTNHKFFNVWLLFADAAYAMLLARWWAGTWLGKSSAAVLVVPLMLSGLLELPPVMNDRVGKLPDWPADPIGRFLVTQTTPRDVLATSYHIYHPATLTGRPILLGWPYFAWSAGYPTGERERLTRILFETDSIGLRCALVRQYGVRYLIAGRTDDYAAPYHPDLRMLSESLRIVAQDERYVVFDPAEACEPRPTAASGSTVTPP